MQLQKGDPFGTHRVIEPEGVLPQPAWRLDSVSPLYANECLIDVECLNIDSASFVQIKEACEHDDSKVKEMIMKIITDRGKMHNPVTGSGGMLIGRVSQIGVEFPAPDLQVGDQVATLVSLTLTPLLVEEIQHVNMNNGQILIKGKAILFASCPFAILPEDLPESVSLAALDVCGAPAQVARLVQPSDTVVVLGAGGKSGLLSLAVAWQAAGKKGKVIAIESNPAACEVIRELGMAHEVQSVNAKEPLAVKEVIEELTDGKLADITVNCVNVPDTELSSILATRDGGTVYFFSTAVKFTAAALGAEGAGKDVQMMIGNGYAPGHAELTLQLLRDHQALKDIFYRRYQA
ncbi:zinc-binding dehydrogenase [Thermoactinomyces sp. DSM 45892]|uniref:L-erythro-3,5-diaminohexanoate dehydrogenase n=1 Tax=Thermoactinomyces sp. DSM 45892 TaxID=1882753 RepID=UPI00089B8CBE|nr:zinc-binding dehydrogenase [Thermoactinomyces sp. DSM 45892]SDY39076.1 L-erythro-3,5-diaminohexanoate dehydrogenase [Thermoactinomyces sp. DSM 45892]